MSGALIPLGGIDLAEAIQMRDGLIRSIAGGALSVRYSDGSQVTYRSQAEMRDALRMVESSIAAASAPPGSVARPSRFYFSTSKGL